MRHPHLGNGLLHYHGWSRHRVRFRSRARRKTGDPPHFYDQYRRHDVGLRRGAVHTRAIPLAETLLFHPGIPEKMGARRTDGQSSLRFHSRRDLGTGQVCFYGGKRCGERLCSTGARYRCPGLRKSQCGFRRCRLEGLERGVLLAQCHHIRPVRPPAGRSILSLYASRRDHARSPAPSI